MKYIDFKKRKKKKKETCASTHRRAKELHLNRNKRAKVLLSPQFLVCPYIFSD